MNTGLIALIIVLAIIVTSVLTKRCTESLIIGSMIAAFFLWGPKSFLANWASMLQREVSENVWIILVCGLFGSLIVLLRASKGSFGFSKVVTKICNTQRKTMLMSFLMGIVIFVDDYLNVLSIGVCIKNVYDDRKLPRESLAYLLDATGAPVCVLLPFSTWAAFYASLFFEEESVQALGYPTGMHTYIHAIPFFFYPMFCLLIVFLFAIGAMPKLGAMKKAFQRVETTGKVYSDASRKYNHEESKGFEEDGNIWDFVIPMVVLVAVSILAKNLLMAVIVSLCVCFILYVPRKVVTLDDFLNRVIKGFAEMLPVLFLLIVSFVLVGICDKMNMTAFVLDVFTPLLKGSFFPMTAFILVSSLCFATGSLWGMSAIVAPILFPVGAAIGANPLLIMAAIVSGGAFGSHACFYTDATLLSSQAAGIDNLEHAISQLPYVSIGAALTCISFLICGVMM